MKNYYLLCLYLSLLFLVGCSEQLSVNKDELNSVTYEQSAPITDPIIFRAEPYLNKIVYEDIELRSLASSVTKGCISGDKECQLNRVYRYVVDNYDYYSDPRSNEFIQSPTDTMKVQGGDCEDLTIFMSSLLENIGFKTYLVLTDSHAYSLACGVDPDNLWEYIEQSILETVSLKLGDDSEYDVEINSGEVFLKRNVEQTIALNPGNIWYYGGGGSIFTDPIQYMDIGYSISSSTPLNIYFVPSIKEQSKMVNGESFTHYLSCQKENVYQVSDSCDSLDRNGGIILVNTNSENMATVSINFDYRIAYSTQSLLPDGEITYYDLNGEQCVVLEATVGKSGFPGFDSTMGVKIAIDPVTKEYFSLD